MLAVTTDRRSTAVHDEPAYRASEVAHVLALPSATVQAWSFGHDYLHSDGTRKRFARVIEPADARKRLLSFANMCELHLLGVIRRHHRVQLPQVRKAVAYMQRRLGEARPLLSRQLRTNGIDLFVESAGQLLNVSKEGQQALRDDFERALSRVDFNRQGDAIRLFPFTKPTAYSHEEQPRTVVVDPQRSFGRPVVIGAYVRTEVIKDRFLAGDSMAEMADDYRVSVAEIEEAIRFEDPQRAA